MVLKGGLSDQLSSHLSHQVNRGLSFSMNPLEIGGPGGAIYQQLLVLGLDIKGCPMPRAGKIFQNG